MEQQNKSVIIIGGGNSVRPGITLGLWDKIKEKETWSLNSAFIAMPYLPKRQLFVDMSFLKNNLDRLSELANSGVKMISKETLKTKDLPLLTTYQAVRNATEYLGLEGIKKGKIFSGQQGLCGTFALHIAVCEEYDNIFLLGYDFGVPKDKINEKITHFYQGDFEVFSSGMGKPHTYLTTNEEIKPAVSDYKLFASGNKSKIYNVSLESNIPYFEKISYESFFEKINV